MLRLWSADLFSSRLFWKIFAAYAALTSVSVILMVVILSNRQREVVVERVQQRLHDLAVVLRNDTLHVFEEGASAKLQETLKRLGQETETRMTIVADDGEVLGDSDEDPKVMENHRNREELLQARVNGFGLSQRPSPTLGIPMMYCALRVDEQDEPIGFVRVAMPMESVNAQISSLQRLILITGIFVSLAALVLTYIIVGRIIRPLASLTQAATAIAGGDLEHEVDIPHRDELGTLATAFNSMSRQLSGRIAELQRKSQEIGENSERLETVLGGMVEGVIAIDDQEQVLFANQAAHQLLEFSTPDVVGRPIWEAVRTPAIQSVVRKALETKEQTRIELELTRTRATVELNATRLPGATCPGVVMVLHDVTELRRLENVRRQFASNVSHELKTPLASIQAYAETLLDGAIDDSEYNRKFLHRIEEQAERLHVLIIDLLRLSRIESGLDAFEMTAISVREAVELCVKEHADVIEAKNITIKVEPAQVPVSVMADEEGFRSILNNLIDNAVNYTPHDEQVTVRWRIEDSMAVIDVEDRGCGIAQVHLSRIFERFYRVDKARSREMGGTGLGLSIVKHLAEEFGGGVEVASVLGKGSTFTVRLPLASSP